MRKVRGSDIPIKNRRSRPVAADLARTRCAFSRPRCRRRHSANPAYHAFRDSGGFRLCQKFPVTERTSQTQSHIRSDHRRLADERHHCPTLQRDGSRDDGRSARSCLRHGIFLNGSDHPGDMRVDRGNFHSEPPKPGNLRKTAGCVSRKSPEARASVCQSRMSPLGRRTRGRPAMRQSMPCAGSTACEEPNSQTR